ncbi:ADP-ribosylglycohydrolase family protein [Hugenholtzia roseola]|uniref:ADP-ribosylglycohydrolase family protein n=1 Tax=Hugenholtzia roseola TaxID=1002 RepID=UPI00068919F5|nr:ADP-ribosylglycohydrolase family protein [Hugenholtzia roseola]
MNTTPSFTLEDCQMALLGVALADALGVPYEFRSRDQMQENPATTLIGYGSHHQPIGTWSDDSSLTFCLAESLAELGLEDETQFLNHLAQNFCKWLYQAHWTAHGKVFDVGNTTRRAIRKLKDGTAPLLAGESTEDSNGNGSLMRILPLLFYVQNLPIEKRFDWTKKVSSLTHAHIRSVMACFYYIEFAKKILEKKEKMQIYRELQKELPAFFQSQGIDPKEIAIFDRLLKEDITAANPDSILGTGYVLHSIEASVWCLLTTESFTQATLQAVNLGKDTDTTAAITGGLAALYYVSNPEKGLPPDWLMQLVSKEEIRNLGTKLYQNTLSY